MATWILLVYVWGYESSIHDHVEFSSKTKCEAAIKAIRQDITVRREFTALVCVEK